MDLYTSIRNATVGGCILGLSTSAYLALKSSDALHIIYVGGLFLGGAGVRMLIPSALENDYIWLDLTGGYGSLMLIAGGVLTGMGTTIGHGCTSGHGLCGLARLSKRSLLGVVSFFSTGLLTATVLHPFFHKNWVPTRTQPSLVPVHDTLPVSVILGAFLTLYGFTQTEISRGLAASFCSILFAFGLGISGMLQPTKIHGFLALTTGWDPSLAFVMAGGLLTNLVLWPVITKWTQPITCPMFDLPKKTELEGDLVVGGVLFGIGWAVGGLCPGPGMVGIAGPYGSSALIWTAACVLGQQLVVSFWKKSK
eukprot:jgi/Bigna1/78374/fgenesh1_pg.54_\